jgi:hypothetical protein
MSQDDMFKSEAQRLITELRMNGWSNGQIAKAIGRDPKMISYAAKGEKPFANGVPALQKLTQLPGPAADVQVETPRRTSKAGGLANVRGGLATDLQNGRYVQTKKNMDFMLGELRQAADAGRKVNVSVRFKEMTKKEGDEKRKHASVSIYGRGAGDKRGYYAKSLLERVQKVAGEKGVSEEEALGEIMEGDANDAAEENYDEEGNGVEQFSMTAYDV